MKNNIIVIVIASMITTVYAANQSVVHKPAIHIILGSTRQGRTSGKVGNAVMKMLEKRADINAELVDLQDFNLPFFDETVSPAYRKSITDPVVKKWSDKISKADAFIIVVPEYNHSFPGVLKNALDHLYTEWNHKPIAFVGYSGGSSGGTRAIEQLRQIVVELRMIPVRSEINIPEVWQAFDEKENLINKRIEQQLSTIIDELLSYQ
jgi:NAD(P)H-dependent FMN reductase